MTRIISALLVAFSSAAIATSVWAGEAQPIGAKPEGKPLELVANAPDRYVVTAGDTLWGIAGKFVNDPYRWPSLWRLNDEQIRNPHRIYPGQVLLLRRGAEPTLEIEAVRMSPRQIDTPLVQEIPAIPQHVIEPYLARPLIIEADGLDSAPRIVALQEGRLLVGTGGTIYATGITGTTSQVFQIYRPGKALKDPVTQEVLGHEATLLGTARISQAGDPAILRVSKAIGEIGRGDRLTPLPSVDVVSYVPHAPKQDVDGRVMSVIGSLIGGPYSIVTLNRGTKDGMEIGHVLALSLAGIEVTDRFKGRTQTLKLPDERYGLVFVFRAFDRISYALVMQASHEVSIGDAVRTP